MPFTRQRHNGTKDSDTQNVDGVDAPDVNIEREPERTLPMGFKYPCPRQGPYLVAALAVNAIIATSLLPRAAQARPGSKTAKTQSRTTTRTTAKTSSKPAKPTGVWGWTSGTQTYLRARPGALTPPIAKVPRHTKLFVWGKFNGWYRVETPDHKFGWVFHSYIRSADESKIKELSHRKARLASDRTANQTMYGSPQLLRRHYVRYGAPGAAQGLQQQGVRVARRPRSATAVRLAARPAHKSPASTGTKEKSRARGSNNLRLASSAAATRRSARSHDTRRDDIQSSTASSPQRNIAESRQSRQGRAQTRRERIVRAPDPALNDVGNVRLPPSRIPGRRRDEAAFAPHNDKETATRQPEQAPAVTSKKRTAKKAIANKSAGEKKATAEKPATERRPAQRNLLAEQAAATEQKRLAQRRLTEARRLAQARQARQATARESATREARRQEAEHRQAQARQDARLATARLAAARQQEARRLEREREAVQQAAAARIAARQAAKRQAARQAAKRQAARQAAAARIAQEQAVAQRAAQERETRRLAAARQQAEERQKVEARRRALARRQAQERRLAQARKAARAARLARAAQARKRRYQRLAQQRAVRRARLRRQAGAATTEPPLSAPGVQPLDPAELLRAREEFLNARRKPNAPVGGSPSNNSNGNALPNNDPTAPLTPSSWNSNSRGSVENDATSGGHLLDFPSVTRVSYIKKPKKNAEQKQPRGAANIRKAAASKVASSSAGGKITGANRFSRGGSPRDYARYAARSAANGTSSGLLFGQTMAKQALAYRGIPYRGGAASPNRGFDCSGLVYFLLRQRGYNPPRTSGAFASYGKAVKRDAMQAGDIVLFANTYRRGVSHVGIYMGEGKFVHAASSGKGVRVDSLSSRYYARKFYGARRVK